MWHFSPFTRASEEDEKKSPIELSEIDFLSFALFDLAIV